VKGCGTKGFTTDDGFSYKIVPAGTVPRSDAQIEAAWSELKAALSSAPQGWRPIETAPKDGTLVWGADARIPYPIYYSIRWQHHGSHGAGWYTSWDATYVSGAATHWQPLPAAPATKEGV
jgi:hypothetical protein